MLIDAHFHIWSLARGDYGWITPETGVLHQDFDVPDMLPLAEKCGIEGAVLVQATDNEEETRYLLSAADRHAFIKAVVGWVDLQNDNAIRILDDFHRHPAFRGIRAMLQDLDDIGSILAPQLAPVFNHLSGHGLSLDVLIRPHHMKRISKLAVRYPELSVIIDHAGKPDIASQAWQPWADDLTNLASFPNVTCKLSGLLTEAAQGAGAKDIACYVDHVIGSFGAQRTMWGSDWPVLLPNGDYLAWWQSARALVPLSMHNDIFGATANRVYRLGMENA